LYEVDEAANRIRNEVDPEANIIVGSTFDENLAGRMRVSVVATGIDCASVSQQRPPPANVTPMIRPVQLRPVSTGASGGQAVAFAVSPAPTPAQMIAQPAPQPVAQVARQPQAQPVQAPLGLEVPVAPPAAPPAPMPPVQAAPAPEPPPALKPALRPTADRNEPFIPPRAAEPEQAREPTRVPESYAEASADAKSRRPNLLERITRTGRARIEQPLPARTEPVATRPTPAAPAPKPVQKPQTLAGLEPAERLAPPREEDLLDIPAFLRRQAN
jgi:cell division protein FtsZ